MMERIRSFMFEPQAWMHLDRMNSPIPMDGEIAKWAIARPNLKPSDFDRFANRMALLSEQEWEMVGLGVSLAPYFGKVGKSLDGVMRRVLTERLTPEQISALDQLTPEGCFELPNWRDQEAVIAGGIHATVSVLPWEEELRSYHDYKFARALPKASVSGLTITTIEGLCQHLLPNSVLFS